MELPALLIRESRGGITHDQMFGSNPIPLITLLAYAEEFRRMAATERITAIINHHAAEPKELVDDLQIEAMPINKASEMRERKRKWLGK